MSDKKDNKTLILGVVAALTVAATLFMVSRSKSDEGGTKSRPAASSDSVMPKKAAGSGSNVETGRSHLTPPRSFNQPDLSDLESPTSTMSDLHTDGEIPSPVKGSSIQSLSINTAPSPLLENDYGIRKFDSEKIYECVVVGAGAAGLSAASQLVTEHGMKKKDILIIEAQSYVGGRIKQTTDFIPGLHVDVGAELVHGSETSLNEIIKEADINHKRTYVWAQGDGGPYEEPVDGTYGLYYVKTKDEQGNSNAKLLRYDTKNKEFQEANNILSEIGDLAEVDDGKYAKNLDENVTLYDYLQDEGMKHGNAMMGIAAAGYANTLCSNVRDLSLKGVIQWAHAWDGEEGLDEDYKVPHSFKVFILYFLAKLGITDQSLYSDGITTPPRPAHRTRRLHGIEHTDDEEKVDIQVHCVLDTVNCTNVPISSPHTDSTPISLTVRSKISSAPYAPMTPERKACASFEATSPNLGGDKVHTPRRGARHLESHTGSSYDRTLHDVNVDGDDFWGKPQNIRTRSVVVATPNKVLRNGRIQFIPSLPDLQMEALETRNMNTAMKIILKFSKRCWPEGLAGTIMAGSGNCRPPEGYADGRTYTDDIHPDECLIPEVWFNDLKAHPRFVQGYVKDDTTCYCTAFLTAGYAERARAYAAKQAAGKDDTWNAHDVLYGSVLLQLEEAFSHLEPHHMLPKGHPSPDHHVMFLPGGKKEGYNTHKAHLQHQIDHLPKPSDVFLGGMVYVWDETSHPFIGGGYSSPRREEYDIERQRALSETVPKDDMIPNPGLFFAGECSTVGPGATAHSAIDTGVRAARQVAEYLKKAEHTTLKHAKHDYVKENKEAAHRTKAHAQHKK
jgi:hypothetical protein